MASRIRELREAAGLTQRELAQRAQSSIRSIREWEQGRRPTPGKLRRLARALRITVEELDA